MPLYCFDLSSGHCWLEESTFILVAHTKSAGNAFVVSALWGYACTWQTCRLQTVYMLGVNNVRWCHTTHNPPLNSVQPTISIRFNQSILIKIIKIIIVPWKAKKIKITIERLLVNYPSMATSTFHWLVTVTSGLFLVWYGRLAGFTLLPTFPNLVSVRSFRPLTGSRSISVTLTGLVTVDFETVNVISRAFCCYEMSLWPWCTLLHCSPSISRSNQLLNKYTLLSK